jgi:solute carrier family 32 (vesicular inhibitory amino acid transporter)
MFVVSLPFAVQNGGYWALISMLLVAYICCYTGKILVDCLYDECDDEIFEIYRGSRNLSPHLCYNKSRRLHRIRTSYVEIAKDVWGSERGANIVNIAQNIELLMTCILYLVLCGDLLLGTFPNWQLDHSSWTIISCVFLIPCAFIRSLKFVSRLSFCNAVVHVAINLIIVFYCVLRFSDWDFSKVNLITFLFRFLKLFFKSRIFKVTFSIDIWSFPISLGIIVFSYTSQIFLPSIEGSLVDRKKFDKMLNLTHLVAAIFKAAFGYVCFLLWQDQTQEVITNNLPTFLKVIVNLILVVKALLSYPLPYFASIELLESTLFLSSNLNDDDDEFDPENSEKIERRRKQSTASNFTINAKKPMFMRTCYDYDGDLKPWALVLRISLILFTLFLAIFMPFFANLMGLVGSITGTALSLVWPCYFHLHLKRKKLTKFEIFVDVSIIVFALFITITGVYYSGYALISAFTNVDPNYYKKNKYYSEPPRILKNQTIHSHVSNLFSNRTL